jgi:hypothetical protein
LSRNLSKNRSEDVQKETQRPEKQKPPTGPSMADVRVLKKSTEFLHYFNLKWSLKMSERKMKKVRIDETLLEQIDNYDLFPRGVWSKQAKINYLIQIGLSVLLIDFEKECKEKEKDDKPFNFTEEIIRNMAVERLIKLANETKIPKSQLARLVNRTLFE